ncbi:uncharacterized protein EV154DRAFT_523367 [Mucor mucedo]|uniref:uncharacterized protein n=1 Tax=Mucor mucedo TaxID=29922 RepID=UPI00221F0D1A|nr:uncharacterized protein EV154DRAFT_523367 [Mucor mucedo]KAI7881493.1 hypothetical protein EV154DRAFT_523367 [Mucor mucedo]
MNPKAIHIIRPSDHAGGGISFIRHEPVRKLSFPSKQPPPPLKRPTLLYTQRSMTDTKPVILSEKALYLHNQQQLSRSVISGNDNDDSATSDEEDDDNQDARTNRKMADLEISNQSLLIVNQILETTVRDQAKQVASFIQQQQRMTLPIEEHKHNTSLEQQEEEDEQDWQMDEQFTRLRRMTEFLIEQAQNALVEAGPRTTPGMHHRRSDSGRRSHHHRSQRSSSSQQP